MKKEEVAFIIEQINSLEYLPLKLKVEALMGIQSEEALKALTLFNDYAVNKRPIDILAEDHDLNEAQVFMLINLVENTVSKRAGIIDKTITRYKEILK